MSEQQYRELGPNELIQEGDEVNAKDNGPNITDARRSNGWLNVSDFSIGKPASHNEMLMYRRPVTSESISSETPRSGMQGGSQPTRKNFPIAMGLMNYFPNAQRYKAYVSYKANEQHNPGEPMHWAKEKSKDHLDCIMRHILDHLDEPMDEDELLHLGKVAWRADAALEVYLNRHPEHNPYPSNIPNPADPVSPAVEGRPYPIE